MHLQRWKVMTADMNMGVNHAHTRHRRYKRTGRSHEGAYGARQPGLCIVLQALGNVNLMMSALRTLPLDDVGRL